MRASYNVKIAVSVIVFLAVCAVAILFGVNARNEHSAGVPQATTERAAGGADESGSEEKRGTGDTLLDGPSVNDRLNPPSIDDRLKNDQRGTVELPEGNVELVTGEFCREIYVTVGDATFRTREFPAEWGPSTVVSGKFTKYSEFTGELFFTTNEGESLLFVGGTGVFFTTDCPSY